MRSLEIIYNHYCKSYSLTTDSRKVVSGMIYLALRGDRFDGNQFAQQALDSGASLVILDNVEIKIEDNRIILVEDCLKTLQLLANHHRRMLNIPVIALTGSNGKTTTKELLNEGLSTKYNVMATSGNFNNHIGVPLTLLKATPMHDIMIIEMGANHVGEIRDLCRIALPDIGLITNIGKAHLEGFGGYKGVIKAKSEMYEFLKSTGGTIVYNQDDNLLTDIVGDYIPKVPYSPKKDFELIKSYPNLTFLYNSKEYSSKLVGGYNLQNIATAVCVGSLMQCEVSDMMQSISNYLPSNNRSQTITKKGIHFILDAYNANPSSMKLAIQGFGHSKFENKVLILGDMLELGTESVKEHEQIIIQCLEFSNIEVVFVGPIFQKNENDYKDFKFVASVTELESYVNNMPRNTHCFVKGSRGLTLEKVLDYLV